MSEDTNAISLGQAEDRSRNTPEKPPLPSRWWILTACLLAVLALAGQGASILGLFQTNILRATLDSQIDQARQELAKLRTDVTTLRDDESTARATLAEIDPQVSEKRGALAAATTSLDEANKRLWKTQEALELIIAQGRKVRDEKLAVEAAIKTLKKAEADLTGKVARLTDQHNNFRTSVDESDATIKQQDADISSNRSELKRLDQALGDMRTQQRTLQEDLLQLQREASSVRELIAMRQLLNQDVTRLKAESQNLTGKCEDLEKQVVAQESNLKSIAADIMREQESLSVIRSTAETIRTSADVLTKERDTIQIKVDDAKKVLNDVSTQIDSQTRVAQVRAKELQTLDSDFGTKQEEYNQIVAKIARAKVEESNLLKRLAELRPPGNQTDDLDTTRPTDEPSLPAASPGSSSASEPAVGKPPDVNPPPSKPEPTEIPEE